MDWIAQTGDRLAGVLGALPSFLEPMLVVLGAILLAVVAHWAAFRLLNRAVSAGVGIGGSMLRRARRPVRLAFVLFALVLVLPRVSLPVLWQDWLQHTALIMLIVLLGWTPLLLSKLYAERSVRRYRFDTDDNLAARKFVTQVRVLRRTFDIVVIVVTVSAVLLTFEGVQEYGVSLFASAGAVGLVLGLAARPVLSNLIAGIQIAITQPIRLEDVVIVEGEWGCVWTPSFLQGNSSLVA